MSKTATKPAPSLWQQFKQVFVGPGSLTDFGERYILLDKNYQSSTKGIYAIGDVAGTPDIKAALNAGYKLAQHINKLPKRTNDKTDYDVVIIGAGPAGINAASELQKAGKRVLVLERKKIFQTIRAFAKSKALYYASTGDQLILGDFPFQDCLAKECIDDWDKILEEKKLNVQSLENVIEIKQRGAFEVWTENKQKEKKTYLADRVIVAIGKPKLLGKVKLAGASDQRIRYQLHADNSVTDKKVLVIAHSGSYEGFEMALDLAGHNDVTLLYEEAGGADISVEVASRIDQAVSSGRIKYYKNSQLAAIHENSVDILQAPNERSVLEDLFDDNLKAALDIQEGDKDRVVSVPNDVIFTGKIIDRELPVTDLKQLGLNTERRMSPLNWALFAGLFVFFAFVYISKSSKVDFLVNNPVLAPLGKFFVMIRDVIEMAFQSVAMSVVFTGLFAVVLFGFGFWQIFQTWKTGFGRDNSAVDKLLVGVMSLFLLLVSFGPFLIVNANLKLRGQAPLQLYQIWSLVYSAGIVIFGFKAIYRYRTQYRDAAQGSHQTRKLLTLMVFQVFFLCILPEVLLQNWRAYGLVLAWPLNLKPDSYAGFVESSGQILRVYFPFEKTYSVNRLYFAWNIFLTLGLIPLLVWKGGMRYCTWICSCGGLAETVGDEWRQFSPKGPANTKRERFIYVVLGATAAIMLLQVLDHHQLTYVDISAFVAGLTKGWSWIVDLAMCGIIPLVLYPFMSGRTWCRFACPTAGFMKLMSRQTTETGIQPDRKRCIACGMCDRYCEVGVPIRRHALKGQFFSANDTTCISCGVCISVCPTDTLRFDKHPEKRILPMAV